MSLKEALESAKNRFMRLPQRAKIILLLEVFFTASFLFTNDLGRLSLMLLNGLAMYLIGMRNK